MCWGQCGIIDRHVPEMQSHCLGLILMLTYRINGRSFIVALFCIEQQIKYILSYTSFYSHQVFVLIMKDSLLYVLPLRLYPWHYLSFCLFFHKYSAYTTVGHLTVSSALPSLNFATSRLVG